MKKLLIFLIICIGILTCDPQCNTCQTNSPYSCTSCFNDPIKNLYIKSCQAIEKSSLFLAFSVVIIITHLFMLIMGYGVYRNIFQNIQLISIITWGYGSQSGIQQLQVTNFGVLQNNKFLNSYGAQFFIQITIIGIFIVLVSAIDRLPHNALATLIKRKKIIFPIRIQTLIFNMTIFSAMSQVYSLSINQKSIDIFQIILAIIALIKQFAVLLVIGIISNSINFQLDDQNYYVLVQKLSTCRWYTKNNLFFSLICRFIILIVFVTMFDRPQITGIVITIIMICYTIISAFTLRYIKLRYGIFNIFGNVFTCACFFCEYGTGSQLIGSTKWQQYRKAYYTLVLMLCCFFLVINLVEMIANSSQISKQFRSIYHRFIVCEKMDDAVQLNKYDSDKYRVKVTSFRRNLIHNKNVKGERQEEENQENL